MGTIFFYSLGAGMLAMMATVDTRLVAWKFVRLVVAMVFAMECLVSYWAMRAPAALPSGLAGLSFSFGAALGGVAMLLIFLAPMCGAKAKLIRVISAVGGACGLFAAVAASLDRFGDGVPQTPALLMLALGTLSSAMLLGSITVSWLLGHAYLTATKMTIQPLRHFSRMLSLSIAVRVGFFLLSLLVGWQFGNVDGVSLLAVLGNAWLVVSLRVGVGMMAIAVFAYMVADCVRLRATQSATGILYFASIFVYVGELASQQLLLDCGWPM